MSQWFWCLAEVPHLGYRSHPSVQRSSLPGYQVVPSLSSFEGRSTLQWPIAGGSSSASPAKNWQTQPRVGGTEAQTCVHQLYETLELPGVLEDYHFALSHCCGKLWKLRQQDGWILSEIEKLCWQDIRLLQAYPYIIAHPHDDKAFLEVGAFSLLLSLYEGEGYLHEALMVAQIAGQFQQQADALERLQSRLLNLKAEENG